jgi:hypothetical protein
MKCIIFSYKSPVEFSQFIVPICLSGGKRVNYEGKSATISSFEVDAERKIDPDALTKSHRSMLTLSDEACERKLGQNGVSFFDSKLQICSFHEAEDALNDSQPVIY